MRLHWTQGAQLDMERHWMFLAECSVDYADRVEARIRDRAETLTRFPYLGRLNNHDGRRRLSIPDIQYLIDYRVEEDAIRILQIWNTAQNRKDDQ